MVYGLAMLKFSWKDRWPYDKSCSDFEGVGGCQQLKQHALDDRRCCAIPFLELSGLIGCCMSRGDLKKKG